MTVLVIAEHTDGKISGATLRAVTAAGQLGGGVTVLVAGLDCEDAAKAAAAISRVGQVLWAEGPSLASQLAEPLAELVAAMVGVTWIREPKPLTQSLSPPIHRARTCCLGSPA